MKAKVFVEVGANGATRKYELTDVSITTAGLGAGPFEFGLRGILVGDDTKSRPHPLDVTTYASREKPNYVGKVVFLEARWRDTVPVKSRSTYYNGNFLVMRQTPTALYGYYMDGYHGFGKDVYGLGNCGGTSSQRALVGETYYEVIESFEPDWKWIAECVEYVEHECAAVRAGTKDKQWVESVYARAEQTCAELRKAFGDKFPKPEPVVTAVPEPTHVIGVRKGTRSIKIAFEEQ